MCDTYLLVLALKLATEFMPLPFNEVRTWPSGTYTAPSPYYAEAVPPWDRMREDAKQTLLEADQAEAKDGRLRQLHQLIELCQVRVY